MLYNTLGKTGLKTSVLGFGCGPLGNSYGSVNEKETTQAVHCAIDEGINYFDVAPLYGETLSEQRLGKALIGKRNDIILATKAGRYTKDPQTGFDYSPDRIFQSIDESLSRLRTDYIDIYQLHDIEYARKEQIVQESLPALDSLKESGKIRFIGITGYPLTILKLVAEESAVDTILSYCRYTLMDTSLDTLLTPFAREHNLGLINASLLHQGILTENGPPPWQPAPEQVKTAGIQAAEYCRDHGCSLPELAVQFALSHQYVAVHLIGMKTAEEVKQNIRNIGTTPDRTHLSAVMNIIRPAADVVWKSGRPENNDPGAI